MFSWLKPFFAFLNEVAKYFQNQQLINAGKAERTVEEVGIIEKEKKDAEAAVSVVDVKRTDRLRKRFDKASGGE